MVFEANTRNKTEHIMWKGMENCARKWWVFLCTILFEVTWAFCKMWQIKATLVMVHMDLFLLSLVAIRKQNTIQSKMIYFVDYFIEAS